MTAKQRALLREAENLLSRYWIGGQAANALARRIRETLGSSERSADETSGACSCAVPILWHDGKQSFCSICGKRSAEKTAVNSTLTAKQKCIVCHEGPREVPDRENMSPRKMVCRPCHGKRLLGDLREIVRLHNKEQRQ